MSYGREEVITEPQRNNLVEALSKGASGFISLNEIFVQAKDVRIIEPTKDKTAAQLADVQQIQLEEAKKYQENAAIASKWLAFSENWMNTKFGVGRWKSKAPYLKQIKEDYENQN